MPAISVQFHFNLCSSLLLPSHFCFFFNFCWKWLNKIRLTFDTCYDHDNAHSFITLYDYCNLIQTFIFRWTMLLSNVWALCSLHCYFFFFMKESKNFKIKFKSDKYCCSVWLWILQEFISVFYIGFMSIFVWFTNHQLYPNFHFSYTISTLLLLLIFLRKPVISSILREDQTKAKKKTNLLQLQIVLHC